MKDKLEEIQTKPFKDECEKCPIYRYCDVEDCPLLKLLEDAENGKT